MRDASEMAEKDKSSENEYILEYSKDVHAKYPTQRQALEELVIIHYCYEMCSSYLNIEVSHNN